MIILVNKVIVTHDEKNMIDTMRETMKVESGWKENIYPAEICYEKTTTFKGAKHDKL